MVYAVEHVINLCQQQVTRKFEYQVSLLFATCVMLRLHCTRPPRPSTPSYLFHPRVHSAIDDIAYQADRFAVEQKRANSLSSGEVQQGPAQ